MMSTRTRTEILIHCSNDFLEEMLKDIKDTFEIIEQPDFALTMLKIRESAHLEQFYVGEALVSNARVKYQGRIGLGVYMGKDLNKALLLAKIDAVFNALDPIIHQWIILLEQEKQSMDALKTREINKLLETKVEFSTMDKPYEI